MLINIKEFDESGNISKKLCKFFSFYYYSLEYKRRLV